MSVSVAAPAFHVRHVRHVRMSASSCVLDHQKDCDATCSCDGTQSARHDGVQDPDSDRGPNIHGYGIPNYHHSTDMQDLVEDRDVTEFDKASRCMAVVDKCHMRGTRFSCHRHRIEQSTWH